MNAYTQGPHAPVGSELAAEDLPVEGEIPEGLCGLFARNTPEPQLPPPGKVHWFDGDGMVQAVRLREGRADYMSRWVRTEAFELERAAGKPLWGGLLQPLDLTNPHGPFKDTANTDLVFHAGKLLALWWLSGTPYALSKEDLSTLGKCTFGGELKGTVAAHPKVDPDTGELMFFGYSVARKPYYHYGVADAEGRLVRYEAIDVAGPLVPHDIAITPNHTVLLDLPLGYDPKALAQGKHKIGFDKEAPARFGIVPRHGSGGDVRWFEAPSCYVYHTINAYEDGDAVVLVACRIEDPIPESIPEGSARLDTIHLNPKLYRWRFDLSSGQTTGEALDDLPTEFPRANDARRMQRLRYSYNPRIAPREALLFDGVVKYDLETGSAQAHEWAPGCYSGEVVFAPRPGAEAEDDGWLVTVLTDAANDRSDLVVLDAQDMSRAPLAKVRLPRRIPPGFHATWVPE